MAKESKKTPIRVNVSVITDVHAETGLVERVELVKRFVYAGAPDEMSSMIFNPKLIPLETIMQLCAQSLVGFEHSKK